MIEICGVTPTCRKWSDFLQYELGRFVHNYVNQRFSTREDVVTPNAIFRAVALSTLCLTTLFLFYTPAQGQTYSVNMEMNRTSGGTVSMIQLKWRSNMKLLFAIIMILLSVTLTALGQQDEVAKNRLREEADNSLRIARIIKGEIWQPLYIEDKNRRVMRRVFADGTQRDYIFTIFPDALGLTPRWQVKGDYLYTVGMLPGTNQMGQVLLRAPIKDLVEDRTKEEERKMHGVIRSFPPYDMLSLTPLVPPTYPPGTKQEDMERWEEPDHYDLLVDDREILTLVVTTGDKIDIWELDSQDAWSSMRIGGREGVSKPWKRIVSATVPFKGRFVADAEEGRLSLVSETGELWQSDDRKTFNKQREADNIAPDGNSLIVVDTDQSQIWLGRDSTGKIAGDQHLRLIKGTGNGPSERVLRAFEELSGAKPSLKK